jgi:hypothetical protein
VKSIEDFGAELRGFREVVDAYRNIFDVRIHSEAAIRMEFAEFKGKWDVALAATS